MSLELKERAFEEVTEIFERYNLINKAVLLHKTNVIKGISTNFPQMLQGFKVSFLLLREDIERVISQYIESTDMLLTPIVEAKVKDLYVKCLASIRAYNISEGSALYNSMLNLTDFRQRLAEASEIADFMLLSEELNSEVNVDSDEITDNYEEFV